MNLSTLTHPDHTLHEIEAHLYSSFSGDSPGGSYDRIARFYDTVVGSKLYNQLLWGTATSNYQGFARRALKNCTGPLLDIGSGTAVFTAKTYARADQPIILVDRSLEMLKEASHRIQRSQVTGSMEDIALVQADLFDLPFQEECFSAILAMGMFHLFKNGPKFIDALLSPLKDGGKLYFSSLVTDRFVGRQYLSLLHRSNVVAHPRTFKEVNRIVKEVAGNSEIKAWREGNMAYFILDK